MRRGIPSLLLALSACRSAPRHRAFVTNERDGTITVIDTQHDSVVGLRVGARLRGIRLSPDGRTLYVARSTDPLRQAYREADNRIVALDATSGRIRAEYDAGGDPEQLALSPTARRTSTQETGRNRDALRHRLGQPDAGGRDRRRGRLANSDGSRVYVTAETSSNVSVIDASTNRVIATFPVGARPRDAAFTPDGRSAWVSAEIGRTLTVVDTRTSAPVATTALTAPGEVKPDGVAVLPTGDSVYVALGRANAVAVVDAHPHGGRTDTGGTTGLGIGLTADGRKLYTANGLSNDVSVIDTRTRRVVATLKAGDGPGRRGDAGLVRDRRHALRGPQHRVHRCAVGGRLAVRLVDQDVADQHDDRRQERHRHDHA